MITTKAQFHGDVRFSYLTHFPQKTKDGEWALRLSLCPEDIDKLAEGETIACQDIVYGDYKVVRVAKTKPHGGAERVPKFKDWLVAVVIATPII